MRDMQNLSRPRVAAGRVSNKIAGALPRSAALSGAHRACKKYKE